MKKLSKLKLSHMAKEAIDAKEMNHLKGGGYSGVCSCCFTCACSGPDVERNRFDNEFANSARASDEGIAANPDYDSTYDFGPCDCYDR